MATQKISQLTPIPILNSNTSNLVFVATDYQTGISGKISATAVADGLYANKSLNVGNNAILFPNVIGQFASNAEPYLQVNLQNFDGNGSSDFVATSDIGTDTIHFIDVGIQGSNLDQGLLKPLDGYLLIEGDGATNPGANLIIGTLTNNRDIIFTQGGHEVDNAVAKFDYSSGLHLLKKPLTFADGTSQNTSSASASAYANGAFAQANAAFTKANTPPAIANSAAVYANGAFIQANASFAHSNSAFDKANNALANTSGTFNGNLSVTGNLSLLNGSISSSGNMTVNGTMVLANSNFAATESAITIKATANVQTPSNDGYMLHISGKQDTPSRIVFDSFGTNTYGLVAGRTARGTVDAPTAVQAGDVLMRISGNGWGSTGFAPLGIARIDIVASENYTDAHRGSQIKFYNMAIGSNTLQNIATFNGDSAVFSGVLNPSKGMLMTPNVLSGITTTLSIDIANNSLYYFKTNATTTISLSGYQAGKIVEVWLTNTDNNNHTVTHGCLANNSTTGGTSVTVTAGHSAYLRYFSIDGDQANTYVSINYS